MGGREIMSQKTRRKIEIMKTGGCKIFIIPFFFFFLKTIISVSKATHAAQEDRGVRAARK